jgi:scyllo-inositol 2-dehydrogenase (NADP+)
MFIHVTINTMTKNPIKTALLSYGMSGEVFHAPLLRALPEFRLTHIVQRNSDKAKEHFPDVKIVRTVDEIIANDEIEMIVVNTPNETHFEFTSRALKAGKHVVVEKPFTVNLKEADDLIAMAKKHNRILTVFQNRRWDGDFLTLKKVIGENAIGPVVEFEAHYDRFRNYIEANTWKEERAPGTGIVYNLGSHMLDQVVALFGMPLYADARIGIQRPGGKVDDFYDIRLEYSGMLVIVKSSYLVKENMPRYILHGVQGSFVKFGIDPQELALKNKSVPGTAGWGVEPVEFWGKLNSVASGSDVERKVETIPGNYLEFYRNVSEAIREGKSLAVTPEQARDVIRLIEVCYESNRLRQAIRL